MRNIPERADLRMAQQLEFTMLQRHSGFVAVAFAIELLISATGAAAPALKDRDTSTPFVEWAIAGDFASNDPHDPLFVKDLVVVGTDKGELRAYRNHDGKLAWAHQHGKRIFHAPCSDGERIYFTSESGLTAVSIKDGSVSWRFALACCDGPSIALANQGLVYVGGNDGNLYALDAKTGKQRWTSDFISDAPADPPGFAGARARLQNTKARPSALASDGKTLYLSIFDQCRVVAVRADNGKRLWSFQSGGWLYGSAIATDKQVFFGSQDDFFYCVDKQSGKEVWRHQTKGRIESGGVVDQKNVYFGSCDGGLYCLNQSDGKQQWRFATDPQADGRKSAIYSVPILRRGGVCFAAGEGQAYSVDCETGKLNWKIRPSDASHMYCSPATDGSRLFLVTRAAEKGQGEPSLVAVGFK